MAALMEGESFALSAANRNSETKTLLFVKLTDSALKSIEEYSHDKTSPLSKPAIQFHSNNGVLMLPNKDSYHKSFGFTLSTIDADGPQGSFECLQQAESKTLDSLGCMLMKMIINANEDSYEKTRVKMAAVEKENKKFCAKEIKPSGPYVARKVKRTVATTVQKANSSQYASNNVRHKINPPHHSTPLATNQASPNGQKMGLSKRSKNSELLKQSCRDRIIHLLAVRPYKKPELLTRLLNESVKEKERRGISAILSQVAVLKGNSYALADHIWHEVKDTWKFYTPEEARMIKTKKYQMLNNDCSEKISPSVHLDIDYSLAEKRALLDCAVKNPAQPSKKQRIAQDRKSENLTTTGIFGNSGADATTCSEKSNTDLQIAKGVNGHIRTNLADKYTSENEATNSITVPAKTLSSEKCLREQVINRVSVANVEQYSSSVPNTFVVNNISHGNEKLSGDLIIDAKNFDDSCESRTSNVCDFGQRSIAYGTNEGTVIKKRDYCVNKSDDDSSDKTISMQKDHLNSNSFVFNKHATVKNVQHSYNGSEDGLNFHVERRCNDLVNQCAVSDAAYQLSPNSSSGSKESLSYEGIDSLLQNDLLESPEYLKCYVNITSRDQRMQYKLDFNSEYKDYKAMHEIVSKAASEFAAYEDEMNRCKQGTIEYFEIKSNIYKAYVENVNNQEFQEAKKKLDYLHEKLSHIKRLILEYDCTHSVKS